MTQVLICRKLKSQGPILQKIEMSRSNFAEMKNEVIFCKKMISQDFWCNYLFIFFKLGTFLNFPFKKIQCGPFEIL